MKKILLTILALAFACFVSAQQKVDNKRGGETVAIGIRAGGNLASYEYSENNDLNALGFNDTLMKRIKPMLGLNVEFPLFGGVVYVAPEVSFTVRGDSRLFESQTLGKKVCYTAKVNYLEARLPVSIAIPATSWFKPYVFAAPSFGLAMPSVGVFKSEIQQDGKKVEVDSSNMAPYDYGLTAGAGLRFRLNFSDFSMIVKLEGGYYLGFCDTYSEKEHNDQAQAVNTNAYNIKGTRLNRGIEAALTIAIPLDFHPRDDCFYWADMEKKKDKNRGMYGF